MEGPRALRRQALAHVRKYTTEGLSPDGVQEVLLDGGWDGRSCPSADMCHWLLWKLGCRDSRILSRNVPELRISREGNLVQKLLRGAQRLAAWTSFRLENRPECGDIVLSGNVKKGEKETARVFLEGVSSTWTLAEVILSNDGVPVMTEVRAEVRGEELILEGRRETLAGWVDLTLCDL